MLYSRSVAILTINRPLQGAIHLAVNTFTVYLHPKRQLSGADLSRHTTYPVLLLPLFIDALLLSIRRVLTGPLIQVNLTQDNIHVRYHSTKTNTVMHDAKFSLKRTARLAGLLGLIMGIPLPFSLLYVPKKLFAPGDAAATAHNILSHESLFQAAIAGHLFAATVFLFLVLVLYQLFKPVNAYWARMMVALVVVQVPISFLIETLNISALMLLKGDILTDATPSQLQDWAMLLVRTGRYGITVQQLFWGLWLIPYGLLVYQSHFIPRLFGILLLINGAGYLLETFTFLLGQKSNHEFIRQCTFVTYFGEAAIMLWYLIKGVKETRLNLATTREGAG